MDLYIAQKICIFRWEVLPSTLRLPHFFDKMGTRKRAF